MWCILGVEAIVRNIYYPQSLKKIIKTALLKRNVLTINCCKRKSITKNLKLSLFSCASILFVLFVCLFVLFVCLFVCFVCLFVLFVCLIDCLFVLFVCLFVCFVCLFFCLLFGWLVCLLFVSFGQGTNLL